MVTECAKLLIYEKNVMAARTPTYTYECVRHAFNTYFNSNPGEIPKADNTLVDGDTPLNNGTRSWLNVYIAFKNGNIAGMPEGTDAYNFIRDSFDLKSVPINHELADIIPLDDKTLFNTMAWKILLSKDIPQDVFEVIPCGSLRDFPLQLPDSQSSSPICVEFNRNITPKPSDDYGRNWHTLDLLAQKRLIAGIKEPFRLDDYANLIKTRMQKGNFAAPTTFDLIPII